MKLKILTLALATSSLLSGCLSNDIGVSDENICFNDNGDVADCSDISSSLESSPTNPNSIYSPEALQDPSLFQSNVNFVLLNEYVEQLAIDLKENLTTRITSPIAVTSMVNLDSSLQNTTLLGNQISEYFINELRGVRLPVSDHKVTKFIKVTAKGDLAMSRDINELIERQDIGYVLVGTLIKNERGVVVNARIVALNSNQVVASSSKLVPNLVWN